MKRLFFLLIVLVLFVVVFVRMPTRIVVQQENNSPVVYIFGGAFLQMYRVSFDGETEFAVAKGLGRWKATSLFGLAHGENDSNLLVTQTLSHNLLIPVDNLSLSSKIWLWMGRLKYRDSLKSLQLSNLTGSDATNLYLELKSIGFSTYQDFPASILYKAYDSSVLEKNQKLIEGLGFNVFYIKKDNIDENLYCQISGPKMALDRLLRTSFPSCDFEIDKSADTVTFEFGQKYALEF